MKFAKNMLLSLALLLCLTGCADKRAASTPTIEAQEAVSEEIVSEAAEAVTETAEENTAEEPYYLIDLRGIVTGEANGNWSNENQTVDEVSFRDGDMTFHIKVTTAMDSIESVIPPEYSYRLYTDTQMQSGKFYAAETADKIYYLIFDDSTFTQAVVSIDKGMDYTNTLKSMRFKSGETDRTFETIEELDAKAVDIETASAAQPGLFRQTIMSEISLDGVKEQTMEPESAESELAKAGAEAASAPKETVSSADTSADASDKAETSAPKEENKAPAKNIVKGNIISCSFEGGDGFLLGISVTESTYPGISAGQEIVAGCIDFSPCQDDMNAYDYLDVGDSITFKAGEHSCSLSGSAYRILKVY